MNSSSQTSSSSSLAMLPIPQNAEQKLTEIRQTIEQIPDRPSDPISAMRACQMAAASLLKLEVDVTTPRGSTLFGVAWLVYDKLNAIMKNDVASNFHTVEAKMYHLALSLFESVSQMRWDVLDLYTHKLMKLHVAIISAASPDLLIERRLDMLKGWEDILCFILEKKTPPGTLSDEINENRENWLRYWQSLKALRAKLILHTQATSQERVSSNAFSLHSPVFENLKRSFDSSKERKEARRKQM